jgi:hypothetical protein
MKLRRTAPVLSLLATIALGACGAGNAQQPAPTLATAAAQPSAKPVTPEMLEKDPLLLFPSGALGMFAIDSRAFYASQSTGPAAARLAEKYFPVGAEAGFSASRDLDRVVGGVYSMQGADGLATLIGRFDAAKIQHLADSKTQTRGGGIVAASQYAGRALYTVNDVGFTIVSPHLVLAGTKTTIKRALDRMRDGRLSHDAPAWMIQTVAAIASPPATGSAAAAALALDTKSIPLSTFTGGFPLKGTDGMTALRLLANFQPPGMHVAGSATYADDAHAKAGAAGLQALFSSTAFTVLTSALGVSVRDVKVAPAKDDAQIAFAVDDTSMRNLLARLPALFGG